MMLRFLLACLLVAWAPRLALGACAGPSEFLVTAQQLSFTRTAISQGRLSILVLGGAATAGQAAGGEAFTYHARLAARLRERMPDLTVAVSVRTMSRRATADILLTLDSDLAKAHPALVIWGLGGGAAARGEEIDNFAWTIETVAARARLARADLVLMTLQYAPSVSRVVNLAPYRLAILGVAAMDDVPVFDRYDYMRHWNASGMVNLDATDPAERLVVARKVFDCMAEVLTDGIVGAVR